jgi:type I restriction enzyme S subunit
MNKVLKDAVKYSGDRISLENVSLENYVTTDNLLQNKQGKVSVESLPPNSVNVTKYEKGDILISNIRPYLKKIWYASYSGGSSADVLTLKVNKNFNSNFIYYTLFQDKFFEHMMNGSKGTKMPRGDKNQILNFPIPNFPIHTQKSIAKVLSDLDTKIELNNRINRELEAMAKTLYDYWFVQFDFPVASSASATGEVQPEQGEVAERSRSYKSSGGKMVYNAELKREIPEGWEVKNIFKCCNVQYGFPFSTDYFNTDGKGVPVIRIRDILENSISNYSSEQNIDAKYLIKKGDILVGMDGNFHINYWAKDGCYLNQRAVKLSETILPNIYLKYQIEPFIKLREKSVSRTTVGHLSDKDLKALSIVIPSKAVLSSISSIYNGLLKRMIQTKNENQQLSELRDWLLPMLMNGQVTVKESEESLSIAAEPSVEYKKG